MRFFTAAAALLGAAALTAHAQAPAAWVTVSGRVVLPGDGPVPAPKALAVVAPPPGPGCPKGPLLDESVLVNPKNRGVKNVVVWLRPNALDPRAKFTAAEINPAARRAPQDVVIDQPCCQFEPRVAAARVGDVVVVKNSAVLVHNFFWTSANNGDRNVNIPAGGQFRFGAPLAVEGAPIMYKCTAHPWMTGCVRVFDHPYYAVTDADGRFELRGAPAGAYRLVYWHEKVGFKGGKDGRFGDAINVAGGAAGAQSLPPTEFDVRK